MEVKRGYKQTEVGVIPEDWGTPMLGEILMSMQLGGNYKNSERQTKWPLIKMGNLGRGSMKLDKLEYVDISQPPAVRDRLHFDDVLFNTRNTLDLVGKVAIWRNELAEAYFNSNIMRMGFDPARVSTSRFMNYILNTQNSIVGLHGIAIGTTSVAAIYSRDLVKLRIPLPTKIEQDAIAEALSDADALIESLERLLTKKRQIKQGAMQELLTGKKRLPGFSGEWETCRIQDVADVKTGPFGSSLHERDYVEDGTPIITVEHLGEFGVLHSNPPMVSDADRRRLGAYSLEEYDIVFSRVGSIDRNALIRSAEAGWLFSGRLLRLRLNDKYAFAPYLSYQFHTEPFKQRVKSVAVGQTMASLSTQILNGIEVILPTLAEQIAIASVLSDMDSELSALETKLAKARQLKQGMMQELLTGRIRLV